MDVRGLLRNEPIDHGGHVVVDVVDVFTVGVLSVIVASALQVLSIADDTHFSVGIAGYRNSAFHPHRNAAGGIRPPQRKTRSSERVQRWTDRIVFCMFGVAEGEASSSGFGHLAEEVFVGQCEGGFSATLVVHSGVHEMSIHLDR